MSPSSTYHHHNDSTTQPPPSDLKIIQGRFPEASPKSQRHLGVGGRMQWVQSHLASLPADIEEELTSAAWASMPRAHHKQTSKEEKLASMQGIECRHRRREVDISLGHRAIRGHADIEEKELTSEPRRRASEAIDRHRRGRVDISLALTKGIGASRHREERVDISLAPTRGWTAIRSILLHQLASLRQLDLHLCTASSDFKLLPRHRVWELLWVHQCTALTVPASQHSVLASCHKRALQLRALHLHLLAQRPLAQQAVDHHLLSQQHRQHRMESRDSFWLQHRHGHPGHFGHSLQRGHLRSGGFFRRNGHHQLSSFHRLCPQQSPGQQHQFQKMHGQRPRHHHCRHLSCHCSRHLCHCFRLHHHLHLDQSDRIIHQHPNHTEQQSSQTLPTIIQSLHLLLAAQQRSITIEFFLDIDSLQAILFEFWLIHFDISRLSGGILDDLPSIISNLKMEQSRFNRFCFYIIVGCNNIKEKTTKIDIIQVDIEVKHNYNYCAQRPVHQHRSHLRHQQLFTTTSFSSSTSATRKEPCSPTVLIFDINNKMKQHHHQQHTDNNDNIPLQQHGTQEQHNINIHQIGINIRQREYIFRGGIHNIDAIPTRLATTEAASAETSAI